MGDFKMGIWDDFLLLYMKGLKNGDCRSTVWFKSRLLPIIGVQYCLSRMTQSDAFSRYLTAPDRRLAAEYEEVITLPYLVLAGIVRLPCTACTSSSPAWYCRSFSTTRALAASGFNIRRSPIDTLRIRDPCQICDHVWILLERCWWGNPWCSGIWISNIRIQHRICHSWRFI